MTITVLAFKNRDTKVTHFYLISKICVIYVSNLFNRQFYDFKWFSTWKYMKKPTKTRSEGTFSSRKSSFGPFYNIPFVQEIYR